MIDIDRLKDATLFVLKFLGYIVFWGLVISAVFVSIFVVYEFFGGLYTVIYSILLLIIFMIFVAYKDGLDI